MKLNVIAILIGFITTTAVSASDSSDRPFDAARDQYWIMLLNENYERLDAESNLAKNNSTTVADGQLRLAAFYAGVSGCLTSGCQNTLTSDEWNVRLEKLKKWVATKPKSTTAKIAHATFYLEYGWAARGQGFIDTVKVESLEVFRQNVDRAKEELLILKSEGINDPGWYTSLLRVARSQGWPRQTFEALYSEAVSKFPRYIPLYFEMTTYLAPRWYGTTSELNTYINEVTRKTNPILGETLYARLNWLMSTGEMFENGQVKWKNMKKGFERIVKDHPHPWNTNNFAKFACLAGDFDTFAKLNEKINSKPILAAFWGSRKNYDWCASKIPASLNKG